MTIRWTSIIVRTIAAAVLTSGTMPAQERASEASVIALARAGGSYLGIGVAEITPERAKALNLREERGVEVTRVEDDSPAAKGGLKQGDVVLEYNGNRVEGVEQFMRMVRETPPGREVKLSLTRSGGAQQVAVRTGTRKAPRAFNFEMPNVQIPEIRIPDVPRARMTWRSTSLGIEGEAVDSQLAEYFGVTQGVLVRSVTKGSAAERAGIRAGDVILKVNDTSVATPREITSALRGVTGKSAVTITASREKRETTFSVVPDEVPVGSGATGRSVVNRE